jgi:prepilin-type N-terminal cleavage/methylation domain-containing protein
MTARHRAAGFTLVELAVVLVIIGLVIGGVLGAGRLRQNAALTATIAQASSYGSASGVFIDKFAGLPGDLRDADRRRPACSGNCAAAASAATTGDGKIGIPGAMSLAQTNSASPAADETTLFWLHLRLTDLISGTTDAFATSAPRRSPGVPRIQQHRSAVGFT